MCMVRENYYSQSGYAIPLALGVFTLAALNSIVKISASTLSLFASEDCFPSEFSAHLNHWAVRGAFKDPKFGIGFTLPILYISCVSMIPCVNLRDSKNPSLGNDLQNALFAGASSYTKGSFLTRQIGSRLAFLGASILIMVSKVAQLAIAILGAVFSLLLIIVGYSQKCEKLNAFVLSNLSGLDILDTFCRGLRYFFHPLQYEVDEKYLSSLSQ